MAPSATNGNSSHPDADLHPHATGPAASVVAAHQADQPLKLYSGWFCPFVQRVWSVLEEKRIPYQYIEVNPYHKPASLLKLNPRGLVPTLEYDNKPLYESNVILQLLEEAYPQYGPSLLPKDLYERARMRIWMGYFETKFVPAYHKFLQHQGAEGLAEKREAFHEVIKTLAKEMDTAGPYFLGSEPTMIDFVMAPWGLRFWVFEKFKGGTGIPRSGEGAEDEATWERWRTWVQAVEGRKSISGVMSDREHYVKIYQRYAEDRAQSELAKATRKGEAVP